MKKTFLSILDSLLIIISPLMIVGLFFMTAGRVFAFAMDLGMDKPFLKNFIYSIPLFIPFIIYFILLYFRLKSRGVYKTLLELFSKKGVGYIDL